MVSAWAPPAAPSAAPMAAAAAAVDGSPWAGEQEGQGCEHGDRQDRERLDEHLSRAGGQSCAQKQGNKRDGNAAAVGHERREERCSCYEGPVRHQKLGDVFVPRFTADVDD